MRHLSQEEYRKISDDLLAVTEEGPVTEWTERIAQLARAAGFWLSRIQWQGSPVNVACHVVSYIDGSDRQAYVNLRRVVDEAMLKVSPKKT